MDLSTLLQLASSKKASDIHLTNNSSPLLRIDGALVPINSPPLTREALKQLIYQALTEQQIKKFEAERELDFSLATRGFDRFRVNVHMQRGAIEAALRRISTTIPTMESLNLPPVVADLARRPNGLVLVTGPTGSGKTTTQTAMIDLINAEAAKMIICIEDPIEYLHVNKRSIVKQREVYRDTYSFAEALKRCLRQDPDVIVIGEMRDLETISAALTAAETGHLVIATLHTPDAPQTIDRIIDVFPPHQQPQVRLQLASALQGIISQHLLPRASCNGRILAAEILIVTTGVRNLIRERQTEQIRSAMQTGAALGMKTLDKALKELCEKGLISEEVAQSLVPAPEGFKAATGVRR